MKGPNGSKLSFSIALRDFPSIATAPSHCVGEPATPKTNPLGKLKQSIGSKYSGGGRINSLVGTGVGLTVVEYLPVLELTSEAEARCLDHTAWPYRSTASEAVAITFESQLPYFVVDRLGTKVLSCEYGGA